MSVTARSRFHWAPFSVAAAVAITLIVESFAIPWFLSGAGFDSGPGDAAAVTGWDVAAWCGAAAALCALGTLVGFEAARQLLLALATISFAFSAALLLAFILPLAWAGGDVANAILGTAYILGPFFVAGVIFMTTSAIVLILLTRPRARTWTTNGPCWRLS